MPDPSRSQLRPFPHQPSATTPVCGSRLSTAESQPGGEQHSIAGRPESKGSTNITSVTATATAMQKPPFDHLRDTELQFVQITLRNDSQQVAIINGDASEASTGSGSAPAVGGRYLVDSAKPGLSKEKVATVVAAATLAVPLWQDRSSTRWSHPSSTEIGV